LNTIIPLIVRLYSLRFVTPARFNSSHNSEEEKRMKSLRFWFAFILCISLTTFALLPASAQSTVATGSIQGTVTDPNGAVVPNAAITIKNKGTDRPANSPVRRPVLTLQAR